MKRFLKYLVLEHALEAALTVMFVAAHLNIFSLVYSGRSSRESWLIFGTIALVSLFVRAFTQIPFCAWLRLRMARQERFSLRQSVKIVSIWYPIIFFLVCVVPGYFHYIFSVSNATISTFLKEYDGEILLVGNCYLAALLAPIILYKLSGQLYDSPPPSSDATAGK